jgi:hypothetical protein
MKVIAGWRPAAVLLPMIGRVGVGTTDNPKMRQEAFSLQSRVQPASQRARLACGLGRLAEAKVKGMKMRRVRAPA